MRVAGPGGSLGGGHLTEGFHETVTDVRSFRGQGLMGFFQFVEGNRRIPVMYPVVTLVMFEKVVEPGDVGSGAAAGVEMFLDFGPVLKNWEGPYQWREPIQQ